MQMKFKYSTVIKIGKQPLFLFQTADSYVAILFRSFEKRTPDSKGLGQSQPLRETCLGGRWRPPFWYRAQIFHGQSDVRITVPTTCRKHLKPVTHLPILCADRGERWRFSIYDISCMLHIGD